MNFSVPVRNRSPCIRWVKQNQEWMLLRLTRGNFLMIFSPNVCRLKRNYLILSSISSSMKNSSIFTNPEGYNHSAFITHRRKRHFLGFLKVRTSSLDNPLAHPPRQYPWNENSKPANNQNVTIHKWKDDLHLAPTSKETTCLTFFQQVMINSLLK